jgi:ribose transport system substrate-binding protein
MSKNPDLLLPGVLAGRFDRRRLLRGAAVVGAAGVLGACSGGDDEEAAGAASPAAVAAAGGASTEPGETVRIGFSAPGADHGWQAAISQNAQRAAEQYEDVELILTEGNSTNEAQIAQLRTIIGEDLDALVILPYEGQALTDIALEFMEQGITVINLDRVFADERAYRTLILGDNYGMGLSAGNYIGRELGDAGGPVAEITGIASLELTAQRSQGFRDALEGYPNVDIVAQEEALFTVDSGLTAAQNLLQAQGELAAIWNHDDDQGIGVEQAIRQSGRTDEFFLVGGAGSRQVMEKIRDDDLYRATVLYPPTMAASAVSLARLIAQSRKMGDLAEAEVPKSITLYSSTVTRDNVDQFLDLAFDS